MLKAIQVLGSSSSATTGLAAACRWKPHSTTTTTSGFVSFPTCPLSYSTIRPRSTAKPSPSPALFPRLKTRKTQSLWTVRARSTRSESKMDGPSHHSSSGAVRSAGNVRKINFCQSCGGPTKHEIPAGEEKVRAICTLCGRIAYQNPKMVVGCLIEHDNKVLLCKRNIEPSFGLWTLPAGFLEIGESAAEGAIRETREEACAEVEIVSPFAQLDIPLIGQTYVIFLAKLKKPEFSPGPESLECRLFSIDDIPFDSLAFSSMVFTLNLYIEDVKAGRLKFHYGSITKRPGTSPSDTGASTLEYHLQL